MSCAAIMNVYHSQIEIYSAVLTAFLSDRLFDMIMRLGVL
jgi:hypothetical protein